MSIFKALVAVLSAFLLFAGAAEAQNVSAPYIGWNWLGLAGSLALQDKHAEAAEALTSVRALMPGYTPSRFHWGARLVYGHRFRGDVEGDYHRLRDALKASLS